ncbi:type IV secretion system protein VirB4 [Primorskyibacter sedentarius]|uniref:Type IV secretion system protein VirB4 n=1 Tax=Primorskyibacter sedentarius TaxID=745311 RepID=A0A4R3IZR3_9RHOB|nr:DUF87 domain-containing protein [Primorskyibacter sedentarius]TCS56550.1 type IV secretion system protein VirB4 [Primorskyibacter sedentarius]
MALNLSPSLLSFVASDKLVPAGMMHLPYVSLISDTTIRLRDNGILQCLRVEGLDSLTTRTNELEVVRDAIASVIGQIPAGFAIYVHKISRALAANDLVAPIMSGGMAEEIDRRWRDHLTRRGLRDRSLTISVMKHPTASSIRRAVGELSRKNKSDTRAKDARSIEQVSEIIRFFRAALGDMSTRVLSEQSGELLGFLNSIQTGVETPIRHPRNLSVLADVVFNERVTFEADHFKLFDGVHGTRYGDLRAIKDYSPETWVTMFDEFALPCDYVISQSFSPLSKNKAADLVSRQRKIMRSTDDARVSLAEQAARLEEDVLTGSQGLGEHHATVSLISPSLQKLKETLSLMDGVAAGAGVKLIRDSWLLKAHYFSQWPGNGWMRARTAVTTNTNMADFCSLHRSNLGAGRGDVPWASPVALFPTVDGSLRQFNFHENGSPSGAPTAGHSIIIGKTGTGKSLLAGFLMAQLARVDARIFVFDYRRGLEMATRGLRGTYSTILAGEPTGLNPLSVEVDEEGVGWLADWLSRIINPNGTMTPTQNRRIIEVCQANADAPAGLRNWTDFAKQFNMTDDDGALSMLVQEWQHGGRYGWVFGSGRPDSFSLNGNIVGFDLTQIMDADSERERMAVLSYIFRRVERQLRDGRRTVVLIDEAWKAVDNPYFAARIKGWLVSLRKQNCVVVMMAQNPRQLSDSKVGSDIFSSFSTQVLLPNPQANADDFADLRLTDKELSFCMNKSLTRSCLVRDQITSTVCDIDLSSLGNLLHVLGGGLAGRDVVGEDFRINPRFWEKAL